MTECGCVIKLFSIYERLYQKDMKKHALMELYLRSALLKGLGKWRYMKKVMKRCRLDKALHNVGFGSRRSIKKMLHKRLCTVNGKIVIDSSYKVEERDELAIAGNVIVLKKYVYIMLNKKAGYVSSTKEYSKKTIIELLPSTWGLLKIFPVGRLDIDTEGLIILTNNGLYAHKVISPKYNVVKKYYVRLKEKLKDFDDIKKKFGDGLTLKNGYKCLPSTIEKREEDVAIVGLREGKYHQIKKMFLALGNEVVYLKRISIGSLLLDDRLALGESKEISEEEAEKVFL